MYTAAHTDVCVDNPSVSEHDENSKTHQKWVEAGFQGETGA